MGMPCYCSFGYPCPLHPHPPSSSQGSTPSSRSAPGAPFQFSAAHQTRITHPHYGEDRIYPSATGVTQSVSEVVYQNPWSTPQQGYKRSPLADLSQPPAKRQRTSVAESYPPPSTRHQVPSPHIAQLPAMSLPPSNHVDDSSEALKRVQAARATDCWYFIVGTSTKEDPSVDEKDRLRLSDQTRVERTPLELKKPSEPWLRCTECLKFGQWKIWKNNKNGGAAYHIRHHLTKEHRSAYKVACDRIRYIPDDKLDDCSNDDNVKEPITEAGILKYLTEWFAEDDIAFNMVTHRGFKRFFSYIGQGKVTTKDIPDRHTIASHARTLSAKAKEQIKIEIKRARGKISCTADLWTDGTQRAFMSVTVHFINQFKRMVNRLIAFRVIEGSHTGSNLAENFFEVLEEFGVTRKLGMITLDNASNNDTMMAQLEEYMVAKGLDFDRHGNRLRCFPHVINLAVQDILGTLSQSAGVYRQTLVRNQVQIDAELDAYINALERSPHERIRRAAVALRHGLRRQGFQNSIREGNRDQVFQRPELVNNVWTIVPFQMALLELILDCQTRWSSTRNMIQRFLYLYPAISRYIASVPALVEHTITPKDFEVLYDIMTVLDLAHRTQELLSSDRTPTLSLALPLYHALVDQWRSLQSSLPALSHAIEAGIRKIEAYLVKTRSTPAYIVAMALNPSIRYEWIDQNWSSAEALNARKVVKAHMLRCLEDRQRKQREGLQAAVRTQMRSDPGANATKRLNGGYGGFLVAGLQDRPPSHMFSAQSFPSLSSNSSPQPNLSSPLPPVSPQFLHENSATESTQSPLLAPSVTLNDATVELEHQKLEAEPVVPAEELNGLSPIDYWMARSSDLPLTFQVALDILPAQASSVSSERVFSSSKLTCTQYRNQISTPTVEALQILKHSLRSRSDTPLPNTHETLDFMAHHIDQTWGDASVLSVD